MINKLTLSKLPLDHPVVIEALECNQLSTGPHVSIFERELAERFGFSNAITLNSGNSALLVSLMALGFFNKKIVVIDHSTCWAMVNAVVSSGNQPVFCGIEEESLSLDKDQLNEILQSTDVTAIIWPSHFGICQEIHELESSGIVVIEDACQAFHSRLITKSQSSILVLSFYPTKFFNCIDGGAILLNESRIAEKARKLRYYDDQLSLSDSPRFNLKLQNFNAAIGLVRFQQVDNQLRSFDRVLNVYSNLSLEYSNNFFQSQFNPGVYPWRILVKGLSDEGLKVLELNGIPIGRELIRLSGKSSPEWLADVISLPYHEFLSDSDLKFIRETLQYAIEKSHY